MSSAVRPGNREVVAARELGLPVIHRSQALFAVMQGRTRVAVAGTNGKTTTTSMLTVALQRAGVDPSFAIGGELTESGTNAHHGTGPVFVAEADESDGSFVLYRPHVAVVTNVQPDHLDHYGTAQAVEDAFLAFVLGIPEGGLLVACADDPGSRRLAESAAAQGIRVRHLRRCRRTPTSRVRRDRRRRGDRRGRRRHRAAAPAGARVAQRPQRCRRLRRRDARARRSTRPRSATGWPASPARGAGSRRAGAAGGVRVVDDYAHNPGKVAAALAARRARSPGPAASSSSSSRTCSAGRADFAEQFGAALGAADEVVVMDVYAAREDPVPGVTGALVAAAVPLPAERVAFVPSWSAVAAEVVARRATGRPAADGGRGRRHVDRSGGAGPAGGADRQGEERHEQAHDDARDPECAGERADRSGPSGRVHTGRRRSLRVGPASRCALGRSGGRRGGGSSGSPWWRR